MIFHVPFALQDRPTSASGIRPHRMLQAFKAAGYDVWEVSGTSAERARALKAIRRRVKAGTHPDFVYSESSTMPTALTDPNHLPVRPRLDLSFFAFCRKHRIPVGLFYRDIHWMFPEYRARVPNLIALGTRLFYRWDLARYRRVVDVLFLPSEAMAQYLPAALRGRVVPLPPGLEIVDSQTPAATAPTLLFVGGLGPFYRMHEALRGVAGAATSSMILNVPIENWQLMRGEYEQLLTEQITLEHRRGEDLEELYDGATLGSLFVEPIPYWSFAAPMKMFEYLGHGKPMIASEGTYAASFVAQHGLGWTIPYQADALGDLLEHLATDRAAVQQMQERVRNERANHTWTSRVHQAASALAAYERRS